MMLLLTFIVGLLVNFIGYVPPGNINLTLVKITINRGFDQALYFIAAFSVVEFFFTLFIIHAAEWLTQQIHLNVIIDWVMVTMFSVLGLVTWFTRKRTPKPHYSGYKSIRYGIILGVLNPVQVPFWMICGTYLITNHWIITGQLALILLSLGSALGAFLCLLLYARSANYIQTKFEISAKLVNTAIAILFFAFALLHIVKLALK